MGPGPQPIHLDIICRPFVTQEFGKNPKYLTNKNGGSGLMVDPSANPHAYECSQPPCICLEWMWEPFHVGLGPQPINLAPVNMGTVPSGFGASTNAP